MSAARDRNIRAQTTYKPAAAADQAAFDGVRARARLPFNDLNLVQSLDLKLFDEVLWSPAAA
jgi:hypothetical protein